MEMLLQRSWWWWSYLSQSAWQWWPKIHICSVHSASASSQFLNQLSAWNSCKAFYFISWNFQICWPWLWFSLRLSICEWSNSRSWSETQSSRCRSHTAMLELHWMIWWSRATTFFERKLSEISCIKWWCSQSKKVSTYESWSCSKSILIRRSLLVSNLLVSSLMSFTRFRMSTCTLSKISNCCARTEKQQCDSSSELHCQRAQTVSRQTFFADLLSAVIKSLFSNLRVCSPSTTLSLDSLKRFWLMKTWRRLINI